MKEEMIRIIQNEKYDTEMTEMTMCESCVIHLTHCMRNLMANLFFIYFLFWKTLAVSEHQLVLLIPIQTVP